MGKNKCSHNYNYGIIGLGEYITQFFIEWLQDIRAIYGGRVNIRSIVIVPLH
jgi:hypothetical protein